MSSIDLYGDVDEIFLDRIPQLFKVNYSLRLQCSACFNVSVEHEDQSEFVSIGRDYECVIFLTSLFSTDLSN